VALASCGPRQWLLACSSFLPLFPPSFQSHDLQEIIHNIINFFLSITPGPSKIIAHNHQSVFKANNKDNKEAQKESLQTHHNHQSQKHVKQSSSMQQNIAQRAIFKANQILI
jgi:hypothetical protein